MSSALKDHPARAEALDPSRSFIVQAPAGSGKTELLTRRVLSLLVCVDTPEEILAITFTRKAAAEMRARVIAALREAAEEKGQGSAAGERAVLARSALSHSQRLGWDLIKNPSRLRITTIDGFSRSLVARMPWLSRMGAPPDVAENADELYKEAVRRAFLHLEEGDEYAEALAAVLEHFDNRAGALRALLVSLLAKRDQWLRQRRRFSSPDVLRPELERGLRELLENELQAILEILEPYMEEMTALAGYAGQNVEEGSPFALFRGLDIPPEPVAEAVELWRAFPRLFLTGDDEPLKAVDRRKGFPPQGDSAKEWKQRMLRFADFLRADEGAVAALARSRILPDPAYDENLWTIVAPMIRVVDLAFGCLWQVMQERRQCDFSETALRSLEALKDSDAPSELLLALDRRIRHVLVDEFQDTSHQQFELLERLLEGWTPDDGRTLFLVGDPMQSIYRFREAEVTLFHRAAQEGVGPVRPKLLRLEINFRSGAPLVSWFNEAFSLVFPPRDDANSGAVPYSPCLAQAATGDDEAAVRFFASLRRDPRREAAEIGEEVERARTLGNVGILVRSRGHLPEILNELDRRGIPYRGEELATLGERRVVMDIRALAAALLDPADRLMWLSVLRAPWCGLTMADLHALAAGDFRPIPAILREEARQETLSADGALRLRRAWTVLDAALAEARRRPLRPWLEGAWAALGAPSYLNEQELSDAEAAFSLLESLEEGGELPQPSRLDREFSRLFARPDPKADPKAEDCVHVMTIHKAKGLEFDTVLLPGIGTSPRLRDPSLMEWAETPTGGLVVGPAPPKMQGAASGVLDFLQGLNARKEENERVRLLYVAATRAKKRLRFWGHAAPDKLGSPKPASRSLLALLWPAVGTHFQDLADGEFETEEAEGKPLSVARLPLDWELPALPALHVGGGIPQAQEPDAEDFIEIDYLWAQTDRKHIGTVVHRFLERVARDGVDSWTRTRVLVEKTTVAAKLSELGVGAVSLDKATGEVLEAVAKTLEDPRGRWILGSHREAVSEWALTGVSEGGSETGVMDRTFVDEEGTRWIVDFKTTTHEGGGLDAFLHEQAERHRPQLARYAQLMRLREPARPVKAALYYPLLGRFCEVALKD